MAKKKHIVMARNERILRAGLDTSIGHLDFNDHSMLSVGEDSVADEIDHRYGLKGEGDVWTHEDPRRNWTLRYKADGVHTYFFGSSRRYADAWERIFGNKKRMTAGSQPAEVDKNAAQECSL